MRRPRRRRYKAVCRAVVMSVLYTVQSRTHEAESISIYRPSVRRAGILFYLTFVHILYRRDHVMQQTYAGLLLISLF